MTKILPAILLVLMIPGAAHAGMAQMYQATGKLGLEVAGVAGGNNPSVMGTLTLSGNMPPSAIIQYAALYASQTNQGSGLDATFMGTSLGTVGPSASDIQLLGMYTYRWPVSQLITAALTNYSFAIGFNTAGGPIAGVALVVVWSDPTEPTRTVTVIEGMQQVGESGAETETVSFASSTAGATEVWVFTVNDDNSATNEAVNYNGSGIGGPLDRNLGFDASLLKMNGTSNVGNNSLSISTIADHMGWMIGATEITWPPVGVDTSTWGAVKQLYRAR